VLLRLLIISLTKELEKCVPKRSSFECTTYRQKGIKFDLASLKTCVVFILCSVIFVSLSLTAVILVPCFVT